MEEPRRGGAASGSRHWEPASKGNETGGDRGDRVGENGRDARVWGGWLVFIWIKSVGLNGPNGFYFKGGLIYNF